MTFYIEYKENGKRDAFELSGDSWQEVHTLFLSWHPKAIITSVREVY
jgi:hypothetical protein